MAGARFKCDTSDIAPLLAALDRVEGALADEANGRLRAAAGQAGSQLLAELRQSAAGSATPQARIVAESLRVAQGARTVSLVIGGAMPVGSRGTAAGALVWGSEHGGEHFGAPSGGEYWIAPAVDRYSSGGAEGVYEAAVNQILRDAGVL